MFSIMNNIVHIIVLNILVQIQCLVELPAVEDNEIVATEMVVRNTVNGIFSRLKLKRLPHKARFKEFAKMHNFFVSITLQDHDYLKEIARMARVDNINNETQHFITQLNEVLDEDNKSHEKTNDEYITTYVEEFIRKLENLKDKFGLKSNAVFDINTEILKHLNKDHNILQNVTKNVEESSDLDDKLLDEEFWRSSNRRIFAGRREGIKRFPFVASVQFFKKFQCGGSIIKSDLVITSASCLQLAYNNRFFRENPAFLSVQVGCDFYEGCSENIAVLEVYFHLEYNPKTLMNNLAIMRLTRLLKFGRRVKRIKKIDFDRNPWPLPSTTPRITVIGWGARSIDNIIRDPWSNRLSFAELDFYPLKECQEVYSKEYVTSKNFCAGFFSKGGGACNRDVGGPGVAHGILVGVISFGSPVCGAPDAPTVFTKLGYYTDWIEEIMEQHVPTRNARTTMKTSSATYRIRNQMKTTTTYKIQPIIGGELPLEPIHIKTLNPVRTVDENVLFKEFITTMFGSEEVKEYLDHEYETDKSNEETSPAKKLIRGNIKSITTKADIEVQIPKNVIDNSRVPDKGDLVKMVTTIERFDSLDSKVGGRTTLSTPIKYTALDGIAENNIVKLINDIDIQDILKSVSSEASSTDEKIRTTKLVKNIKNEDNRQIREDESESSDSSDYSDNDGDEDLDDDSREQFMSLLGTNKKNVNIEKDDVDTGMSIPAESFKDFTFRQNSTAILNWISQDDLMKLLLEAVADATQK